MSLSTMTSRVDIKDKIAFEEFCSSVGLTSSAAINLYVKAVVRERRIPFEIKQADPFYDYENQSHLMKAIQQLNDGRGTVHELIGDDDE